MSKQIAGLRLARASALSFLLGLSLISLHMAGWLAYIPLAHAEEPTITITDLNNATAEMDGMQVVFIGEAIGDIFFANSGNVWVTLGECNGYINPNSSEENINPTQRNVSIGVYMSSEDAAKIANLGRYHVVGTTLEIHGVFNLACSIHEGYSDVHATSVRVIDPGGSVPQKPDYGLLIFGGILLCVGGALIFLFHILRERQR